MDGNHQDPTRTQHGGDRVLDQGSPWDTVATNEIGNDHGQTKSFMGNISSTHEVVYFHAGMNRARVEARRYSY